MNLHDGVPQKTLSFLPGWQTVEKPKSMSLMSFSVAFTNSTFSSFTSRCATPSACRYSMAVRIWKKMRRACKE